MAEELSEAKEKILSRETNSSEELISLLRKNLERSEEILKISRQTKKFIRWQNYWGFLRFLIIAVPIILGFIYLSPLIKEYLQPFQTWLHQSSIQ